MFIWTQYQCKIKALDIDGGKEFGISKLQELSKEHGFLVRMTTPYTSSMNGISYDLIEAGLLIRVQLRDHFYCPSSTDSHFIALNNCFINIGPIEGVFGQFDVRKRPLEVRKSLTNQP